jgi:ADP-ribose pyrophosphatase YjhB (NUDIX family)
MKWKMNKEPIPQHAVQVVPIDVLLRVLMMHRSEKVRSARNVWSFPSGLHDIGETMEACATRELEEEYGLKPIAFCQLGTYENIGGDSDSDEQYHWVINVLGALVADCNAAVNKEPEKHDQMMVASLPAIANLNFGTHPFHPSFQEWFNRNRIALRAMLLRLVTAAGR